jgi:hypothetical protein
MKRAAGLAVLAALTAAGLTSATALSSQQALAVPTAANANVPGGTRLWAASFRDHTQLNFGQAVVADPDDSTIYVTGSSGQAHFSTVAYDAATGAQRWVARYYGLGVSGPTAMAISPDGSRLFIGGSTTPPGSALFARVAIVAYDARTGARLWARHPFGSGIATSVAVSPDSATLYVTGIVGDQIDGRGSVATFAYDAATGTRKWLAGYHGMRPSAFASSVTASPDGRDVLISTPVTSPSGTKYIATLAYDAATGAPRWTRFVQGTVSTPEDFGIGQNIGVSPDSSAAYVTGYAPNASGGSSFVTTAYRMATGTRLWQRFYQGPGGTSVANALTVGPDGRDLFVTGSSTAGGSGAIEADITTVGYAAASGARLWARSYQPPAASFQDKLGGVAVGVSPDSGRIFVTGATPDTAGNANFTTIAYSAGTGRMAWLARYAGVGDFGAASALAVGPSGRVFVTGETGASDGCCNFGTVAYQP